MNTNLSAGVDRSTLAERIKNHPCYNPAAHRRAARMHLPVARKCNIQCGFCDRRYDCANETRPGVTSQVISPDASVDLVGRVLARIPQLSVIGIAGPGDPLANPEETFETMDRVRAAFPGLTFCLSTNGFALPDLVEEISKRGVEHVTITINAVDPAVAANIYTWVKTPKGILHGQAAAEALLDRQQQGLAALVERNVLVKINTVLIPGVNDHHLIDISRFIGKAGAILHNIMPLIPVPGTRFAHLSAPSLEQVRKMREISSIYVPVMHHCRQCRADAIGFLGQDMPMSCFLPAAGSTVGGVVIL